MAIQTNIIRQRLTGSYTDKFVQIGGVTMKRKFNPILFPTGSWHELWLGFRWRMNMAHSWSGSVSSSILMVNGNRNSSSPPWEDSMNFSAGIYNSSGEAFGTTNPQNISFISHSFGITFRYLVGPGNVAGMNSTGSFMQVGDGPTLTSVVTGSVVSAAQTLTMYWILPSTPDPPQRNMAVIRFITGSSGPDYWVASTITPNANSMPDDFIVQNKLADLFTASNWNNLTSSLGSRYNAMSSNAFLPIYSPQSIGGSFDGVYISWYNSYDLIEISDVVTRII